MGDFALKNADEAEVKKRQHASEILSSYFPFVFSPPRPFSPAGISDSLNSFDSRPLPLPRFHVDLKLVRVDFNHDRSSPLASFQQPRVSYSLRLLVRGIRIERCLINNRLASNGIFVAWAKDGINSKSISLK